MAEPILLRSLRQSSTSGREIQTAGMMRGSVRVTGFSNSLLVQKTRSAGAAPFFGRTTTTGPQSFFWIHDPRRLVSWKKNIGAFYEGLDTLAVRYERISSPYGAHQLNALYFPGPQGSESRPLIVICGGFDSTLEELYFVLVAAGLERGYSVLVYEGPGQGSIIRDQSSPSLMNGRSRQQLFWTNTCGRIHCQRRSFLSG